MLTHPLRSDKYHARSRICTWGQFLEGPESHTQVILCVSHALRMGDVGARAVVSSSVIKYRMCQSCTLLDNLFVVACRHSHHPLSLPQTASVPVFHLPGSGPPSGGPWHWVLTDSLFGICLCHTRHRILDDRRVCQAYDLRRHPNFIRAGLNRARGLTYHGCDRTKEALRMRMNGMGFLLDTGQWRGSNPCPRPKRTEPLPWNTS